MEVVGTPPADAGASVRVTWRQGSEAALRRSAAGELAPERGVARVLDVVVDVARPRELGVQLRQVAPSGRRRRRGARGASRCGTARGRSGRAGDCRTECVVRRRSFERCMPPCSAIERSRLITRQTVRYGTSQRMKYTHGWCSATPIAMRTSCTRDDARGPAKRTAASVGADTAPSRPLNSFQPVRPGRVADELAAHRRAARSGSRGRAGCRARRDRTRRGGAPCARGGTGRSA